MRQTFSISHQIFIGEEQGMSDIVTVEAETDSTSNAPADFPVRIEGCLLNVTVDEIHDLRFAHGVTVSLRGRKYMLECLEQSGRFVIRRAW